MSKASGRRRLVAAIERTRLALPMALAMAGAAAFLVYAIPATIVEQGIVRTGVAAVVAAAVPFGPVARGVLASLAAILSGGAVWWLFDRLERPRRPADVDADPEIDLFAPESAPPRRRADVHPDAPARRPLFAASDLGAPLDDVAGGRTPFGRPPLFEDAPPAPAPAPAVAPRPEEEDGEDMLLLDGRYSMPEPEPEPESQILPLPEPTRVAASDDSIAGMMARLERGLERRGGAGVAPPVDRPELRQALDDLRRMTAGR